MDDTKMRARVLRVRQNTLTKKHRVCKEPKEAYVAAAKYIVNEKEPLSQAVDDKIMYSCTFMDKMATVFEEHKQLFKDCLDHGAEEATLEYKNGHWVRPDEDVQWTNSRNILAEKLKEVCCFLVKPRIRYHKNKQQIVIGIDHSVKHGPQPPFWNFVYSTSGFTQTCTLYPFNIDPIYTVDDDEMIVNEKTGKRKRKYPVGHGYFACYWSMELTKQNSDHVSARIFSMSNHQLFDFVLDRSIKSFTSDLRLLASLVSHLRQMNMTTKVHVITGSDDLFVDQEIDCIRVICGDIPLQIDQAS